MARAAEIPGIEAKTRYADAAAATVRIRTGELIEHSGGVLDMEDIERVHDMRVATRRLRAALEVFRPCFPKKKFKRALREVKDLADALGERRDRDVSIAALEEFTESLDSDDRAGLPSLVAELRSEQAQANLDLEPFVDPERIAKLERRLLALADAAE